MVVGKSLLLHVPHPARIARMQQRNRPGPVVNHDYFDEIGVIECLESEVLAEATTHARSIGNGVFIAGGIGVEGCETGVSTRNYRQPVSENNQSLSLVARKLEGPSPLS